MRDKVSTSSYQKGKPLGTRLQSIARLRALNSRPEENLRIYKKACAKEVSKFKASELFTSLLTLSAGYLAFTIVLITTSPLHGQHCRIVKKTGEIKLPSETEF